MTNSKNIQIHAYRIPAESNRDFDTLDAAIKFAVGACLTDEVTIDIVYTVDGLTLTEDVTLPIDMIDAETVAEELEEWAGAEELAAVVRGEA